MPRGYMEGPAADEAERRLDELERGVEKAPEERLAVFGSTADDPEKHFIGWRDDVDPDELFASGEAWGLRSLVARPNSRLSAAVGSIGSHAVVVAQAFVARSMKFGLHGSSLLLALVHRRDFRQSTVVPCDTTRTWRKPSSSSTR